MDEVKKATLPATEEDWGSVCDWAKAGDRFAPCLLELRRRVEALEAAGGVAGNPGHASVAPAGGWSGVAVDCLPPIGPAVWVGTPADVAPQVVPTTPAVLTEEELADCLPVNAWGGPEGYSRQAFARHLLDHPRIGPLLRGEGAAAPKRVALPEDPPFWRMLCVESLGSADAIARAVWAAARAEVERQQRGGQADG